MTVGAPAPFVVAGMSPITRSRVPRRWSSASPPARLTKSRTHSAARRTSSWCAGSALTDGMATNSRSSSSQACSTARNSTSTHPSARHFEGARHFSDEARPGLGGDVAELRGVREGAQLLQALVLDLPDSLARDVERPPDLVERARVLAVEAVTQLEHLPFARRQRPEDLLERLLAERHLGRLVRQLLVLVRQEVPELRLVLVSYRLFERHRRLRTAPNLLDLLRRELEVLRDLAGGRLTPELGAELPLRSHDLVQLLDDMDRHADRPRLVGERTRDRLADPPRGVRRELEAFAVVELLRSANETDRALLDQIEERQALVPIFLRDRNDQAEVRLHHLLLRGVVTPLDPLGELVFLRSGQQIDLADVLQEELERVGRDLARRLRDRSLLLGFVGRDDLDMKLLERVVEVVDLGRLEIELVQRNGDLVSVQVTRLTSGIQKRLRVFRLEHIGDASCVNRFLGGAHSDPPSWIRISAMPHCASCTEQAP